VERVATQIIEEGEVRRAYLGVRYGAASESLIKNEELPNGAAVIGEVEDGSPADEAGLQAGDIVTAIDGEELQNYLQIGNKIASMRPGTEVTLMINRNGETREISVTLGSASEETETADAGEDAPSRDQLMDELGLSIQNITPEIARQLDIEGTDGVVITDVDRSNPSLRNSGLQERLIIVEIAGQPTPDVETFQEVYAKIPSGEAFRVVVRSPQGFVNVTSLRKPE
jgi:serine protease Do